MNLSDKLLQGLVDNRIAEIKYHTGNYGWDDNIFKLQIELAAFNELKRYRGLAEMRKDMLESDLGHVFGGVYSEDELHICKNCKWWDNHPLEEIDDTENYFVCENTKVAEYAHGILDSFFMPTGAFGCNQWKKKI